jgi:hypothetical protein
MKRLLVILVVAASANGCDTCLEEGSNGFPDPGPDEFQLMFSNIVSRETEIRVNGEMVGAVCQETEFAVVGNFPVGERTEIIVHSLVSGTDCILSPCCSGDCSAQVCHGDPVVNTTPFAGRIYNTALIWMY